MPYISGGGGGGAAFNGGTITQELVVDTAAGTGQALELQGSRTTENDVFRIDYPHSVVIFDSDGAYSFICDDSPNLSLRATGGTGAVLDVSDNTNRFEYGLDTINGATLNYGGGGNTVARLAQVGGKLVVSTTPPLPGTASLSSGTAALNPASRDARLVTPVTFNPTAGAAATCKVEVSADNVTFTTLWTETEPAGIAFDGTIHGLTVWLPAAWYIKLTATNATIGTTTYY